MTNGERRRWPFVRWLGSGKLVWSNLQVSYDLPKRAATARAELCGLP